VGSSSGTSGGPGKDLCFPDDPVEYNDTSCPSHPPEFDFSFQTTWALFPGEWLITITATDALERSGSATVHVTVLSPNVEFPGPVTLTSFDPSAAAPPMLVADEQYSQGEEVTLRGQNLHNNPYVDVYLAPVKLPESTVDSSGGLPTLEWCLYPAEIVDKGITDGVSWIKVKVPEVPPQTRLQCSSGSTMTMDSFRAPWRWVIKDGWSRPGRIHMWWDIPSLYQPAAGRTYFHLSQPEYPMIHGFNFANYDHTPTLNEFLAVYGENAYICVGAFGACATRIPDPLYWTLWFPVYEGWIYKSGKSCAGMSATSLLMYQESIQPEAFDGTVYYPIGFTNVGSEDYYSPDWCTPVCSPPIPRSLSATIRMNHGVQTSQEYIDKVLDEFTGPFSIDGSPSARLHDLTNNPHGYVACMVPKIGKGHCVTPYKVTGNRIMVYDNNAPNDITRYIEVNENSYIFPRLDGTVWSGSGLYTIPIDVWRHERTAPGLSEAGEFMLVLVFGDADTLVTTPEGGAWGWDEDGALIDNLPGAVALGPVGQSDTDIRSVPLMVPMTSTAPSVNINTYGGKYLFHAAQGGQIFQLHVMDAPSDAKDKVETYFEGGRLSAFDYTPEHATQQFQPKVGMTLGDRQRAIFTWVDLALEGGKTLRFKALSEIKGTEYQNLSGSTTHHFLIIDVADGLSGSNSTTIFGPFETKDISIQTASILNWPKSDSLVSQVDTNGDGQIDREETVIGRVCTSGDQNNNGLPDDCEAIAHEQQPQRSSNYLLIIGSTVLGLILILLLAVSVLRHRKSK
jgi:hypothetical protein